MYDGVPIQAKNIMPGDTIRMTKRDAKVVKAIEHCANAGHYHFAFTMHQDKKPMLNGDHRYQTVPDFSWCVHGETWLTAI